MLMAGLDGVANKIEPPVPVDEDLFELPPEELAKIAQVPASLEEALEALEADQAYLVKGRRVHRRPHRDVDRATRG